ncbi:CocE/NonD family hydrolase [Pseudactinotalea sp. HY158]|uniref:CocE/NonD family hydrolase n=1 Tax=Pseudactinotalea sp. HY158 TaxID=2654547 RepID=UPI00129C9F6D|nr:CocE/NonD family hydrolase [Pseudactinotalea sp. HY158]QGH69982.1 CocE/NonD family hydrolase [Pseudactinotalea sp. HY158]
MQVEIDPAAIEVRDLWIPLADGTRLRGRVWLPAEIPAGGVPVVLEYLPYRLDDWTSVRDSERHPYYAAHGYASVRVDVRGTGGSEGLFTDEYSPAELDDGVELIDWLARAPWSNGNVGMFGISWGGFNSLQLAERAPAALKAIVTVCSTDDRYDNDVHYIGGALLGIDMSAWAGTMLAFASRPPHPDAVGPDWVDSWRERLEGQYPLGPRWLAHQDRDDYWRRGSACENYPGISAAVLAVGGWSDPYRDTVLRLLENLPGPVRGIIGPWSHQYPDRELAPGPQIDFLGETLRWWDHWLRGAGTDVMAEPRLRVWVTDSERPSPYIRERSGRWRGLDWPTDDAARPGRGAAPSVRLRLGEGRIAVDSPWNTGQDAGRYFPFGNAADLPVDQRAEDGRSACVDLPVGEAGLDLVGRALVRLRLSSDAPRANVVVRLCDVAPDGSSTLVTLGVLNLLRRAGMDRSDELVPGEDVDVEIALKAAGYSFPAGHTLRVALSNHYWPWVWPHGQAGALSVDLSAGSIELPLLDPAAVPVEFGPAVHARPIPVTTPERAPLPGPERVTSHDVAAGETSLRVDPRYGGTRRYPDGLVFLEDALETYRIVEGDPTSPTARTSWELELAKDDWRAFVRTETALTSTGDDFTYTARVRARAEVAGQERLTFERTYTDVIPRSSV